MSDPTILFVKPKAIGVRDKKTLQAAGVIVVEVEDVANVKLVRAHAELDSGAILRAATRAIAESARTNADARALFGKAICAAIEAEASPGNASDNRSRG